MASEIVTRVALALGKQITLGTVSLGARHDGSENGWIQAARAAIAAMREPTDAMWDAGSDVYADPYEDWTETDIWRSMIDEALKE